MRVNTDELQRQADELQAVARRINDIQDSVLRITRNLCREQFGERFRYPLNQAAASVGRRSEDLRRMRTALQQISRHYEVTETRITDEAEHASVHYEQNGIGSLPIPDVFSGLVDPGIILGPGGVPPWIGPQLDWTRVPPVVPIGVTRALRELTERIRRRERIQSAMEDAMEAFDEAFRDQYGPQWSREGIDGRQLRTILEDMRESVREGVVPDIDSIAEDVARTVRDGISGRVPSMNEQRSDPFFDGISEDFVEAIRDSLYRDGESGYVPPHIHTEDIPPIDPSTVFEGFEGTYVASTDPVGPRPITDSIISAIDVDAGVRNIAGEIPILGNSGSTGAIDWTPWNP